MTPWFEASPGYGVFELARLASYERGDRERGRVIYSDTPLRAHLSALW